MKKKLYNLIVFLFLCQLQVAAQTTGFNYEASIKPVDSSGFYNIVLTPELNAHLKTDYSDLRIVNDLGKWVPHLVRQPNTEMSGSSVLFIKEIIKIENSINATTIIIKGQNDSISNLLLNIKNASAKRYCSLSGSDDQSKWFVINDSIEVVPEMQDNNIKSRLTLLFPWVNYKYYKVVINNNGKQPLNIIDAATRGTINLPGKYFHFTPIENPRVKISQLDSSNYSFIKVEQAAPYHFAQLSIRVSGMKYFNRNAKLYIPTSIHHSFVNPGSFISDLNISNNSTLQFNVPLSKAKTFYIIILNNDNLPLRIDEVKTLTGYHIATVYLEKSKQYKLLLDNPGSMAPNYDLSIKDIPSREKIPSITFNNIVVLAKPELAKKQDDNSKKLIWLAIALAAIILTFFTYRLVTDMNKSKS